MISLLSTAWLCLILTAGDAPAPADVRAEYLQRKAKAAKNAEAQVDLAAWCDSNGLEKEKQYHLAQAILRDPSHARARAMLGVKDAAKPEATKPDPAPAPPAADPAPPQPPMAPDQARDAALDAKRVQYEGRKLGTANTADAQMKLANWCLEQGLADEAKLHLANVIRLDPNREAAWKKLGFRKFGNRWVTPAQIEFERAEASAQAAADRKWRPIFDRLVRQLKSPTTRDQAEAELAAIEDPRCLPVAARTFLGGKDVDESSAVTLFGQIDAPVSTRFLGQLAVTSNSASIRQASLEILRRRDPRIFLGDWISRFRAQVKYEVKKPERAGEPGILLIDGGKRNVQRVFQTMAPPNFLVYSTDQISYDQNGLPVVTRNVPGPIVGGYGVRQATPAATSAAGQAIINNLAQSAAPENRDKVKAGLTAIGTAASYNPFGPNLNEGYAGGAIVAPAQEVQIPVGQMMLQAERSKQDAEQQIAREVAQLDELNLKIRASNEKILSCLKEMTGQDLGTDPTAWGKWWTERGMYQPGPAATPPPPEPAQAPAGFGPLAPTRPRLNPFAPVQAPTPGGPAPASPAAPESNTPVAVPGPPRPGPLRP